MKQVLPLMLLSLGIAVLLMACPKDKPPQDAADAAAAADEPEATPTPAPTPVPTPPPPTPVPATMADWAAPVVTITMRDGSKTTGKLSRITRSDRFGAVDFENRTELDIEAGSNLLTVTFDQIKSMTSRSKGVSDDRINCDYDASATPVTISCNIRTPMEVKLKEKHKFPSAYMVDDTYIWRFYFDEDPDKLVEAPLGAIYVKRNTSKDILEDLVGTTEDTDLQIEMHNELRDVWGKGIKYVSFE